MYVCLCVRVLDLHSGCVLCIYNSAFYINRPTPRLKPKPIVFNKRSKRPAAAAFGQGPEAVAPVVVQPVADVALGMAQAAPQPKLRACYSVQFSHSNLAILVQFSR